MRTRFVDILEGAADLAGLVPGVTLTSEHARTLARAINRALREATEQEFNWPELERCERRFYAPEFDASDFRVLPSDVISDYRAGDLTRVVTDEDTDDEVITYYRATETPSLVNSGLVFTGTVTAVTASAVRATIVSGTPPSALQVAFDSGNRKARITLVTSLGGGSYDIQLDPLQTQAGFSAGVSGTLTVYDFALESPAIDTEEQWEEVTEFPRVIAFAQEGETEMGAVFSVHDADPRGKRRAQERKFRVTGSSDGLVLEVGSAAPDSVWVRYRRVVHPVTVQEWSSTRTYSLGEVTYVPDDEGAPGSGECYRALRATTGDDPAASLDDWELVVIPRGWTNFLQYRAAADFIAIENADQARLFRGEAERALLTAMADVAVAQQQTENYTAAGAAD